MAHLTGCAPAANPRIDMLRLGQQRRQAGVCKHGMLPEYCADCRPKPLALFGPPAEAAPLPALPALRPGSLGGRIIDALKASGRMIFTREDIVAVAFGVDPSTFGLRTYPQWPDSARVWYNLDGKRGLVARGLLRKQEDGRLELVEG